MLISVVNLKKYQWGIDMIINYRTNLNSSKSAICIGLMFTIAGCSVHPLPKDVANAKINTFEIVKNIRCEAKYQVLKRIGILFKEKKVAKSIRPRFILEKNNVAELKNNWPGVYGIVLKYRSSNIGYQFEFAINETNNALGRADFKLPFTNGLLNLGFGGSLKNVRDGKRVLEMNETFSELTFLRCGEKFHFLSIDEEYKPSQKNIIYPLTGSVSMGEIIDTFLDLGALGGGKGETFSDTLIFTTTRMFDIGANVGKTSFPVDKLSLFTAGASVDTTRIDKHKVTITLAFPLTDNRKAQKEQQLVNTRSRANIEARTAYLVALQSCIQNAESREDEAGGLRLAAPEQYCPNYARDLTELKLGNSAF